MIPTYESCMFWTQLMIDENLFHTFIFVFTIISAIKIWNDSIFMIWKLSEIIYILVKNDLSDWNLLNKVVYTQKMWYNYVNRATEEVRVWRYIFNKS